MSASIDTVHVRTESEQRDANSERSTRAEPATASDSARKTLDVSDVDPDRVAAYARATAAEGHPELYFERKGGRTVLVAV